MNKATTRKGRFGSRAGISLAEVMLTAGLATGVALVATRLSSNMSQTTQQAVSSSLGITTIRSEILQAAKDSGTWIGYQKQAHALATSGNSLADCLADDAPYVCPTNDTSITDKSITDHVPASGAVVSMALYLPKVHAPTALTHFQMVAGTDASPLYLDALGAPCSSSGSGSTCVRIATAYFIRQNSGGDPGAVKFIVKIAQNPAALTPGMPELPTTYIRINVGLRWKGQTSPGPIPVGTIMSFAGPQTALPTGYLFCDGKTYSAATYPQLARVLAPGGTAIWNPPGAPAPASGDFYVPDLRGMYLRGLGGSRTLGSFQANAVESHVHAAGASALAITPATPPTPGAWATPWNARVTAIGVTFIAPNPGAFPPSGGGGFVYDGGSAGLTPGPGGTSTANAVVSTNSGVAGGPVTIPAADSSMSWGSSVEGPTPTSATLAGATNEVRPPTAAVLYIIRADY